MMQAPVATPSGFSQFKTLLGKDLRLEIRSKQMLTSMGIYALLVLIVYGAALAQTAWGFNILQMAGGLLWVLVVFTSLLGLNRSFAHEKEFAALDGILLVPLDPGVVFLAKAASNVIFLLLVQLIAVPLFAFFFLASTAPAATAPFIVLPLLVGTLGIAGIGTLLSTITLHTRGKDVLLAVLFIPLVFPLLYACVSATSMALLGVDDFGDYWRSLAMAGGYDVVMILLSWVLYGFVLDA
ncbi:MAG: heme exporter protein CcmB [Coriobacteriales bacterium]|jgi:heme exporter protein B|nr:heme exporter protein CcmB [Coriobacteriales bacterium]